MGWTVRGSNPGGGARFSTPVQTGPGAHPASYTMGTGARLGVKRPGRGAEIEGRVELCICFPIGPIFQRQGVQDGPTIGTILEDQKVPKRRYGITTIRCLISRKSNRNIRKFMV